MHLMTLLQRCHMYYNGCDYIVWETVCKGGVLMSIVDVEVNHCSKIV